MSASLSMSDLPISPPPSRRSGPAATAVAAQALGSQVATVREMLSTLDMFTAAGQRYIMDKVAYFIGQHATAAVPGRNGRHLRELAAALARDTERTCPDVQAFRDHAESVLALLGAVA